MGVLVLLVSVLFHGYSVKKIENQQQVLAATSCTNYSPTCNDRAKVPDPNTWCLVSETACTKGKTTKTYQCKKIKKTSKQNCTVAPPAPDPGHIEVTLSDQTWLSDSTNQQGAIQKDKNTLGGSLKIAGTNYPKGIGVWAKSHVKYDFKSKCSLLTGKAGVDDAAGSKGSINFKVQVDNKNVLFSSGEMHGGNAAKEFTLNIRNINVLDFYADSGQYTALDYGNWVELKAWCDPTVFSSPSGGGSEEIMKEESYRVILEYDPVNKTVEQIKTKKTHTDLVSIDKKQKPTKKTNFFQYKVKVVDSENLLISDGWKTVPVKSIRRKNDKYRIQFLTDYKKDAKITVFSETDEIIWEGKML